MDTRRKQSVLVDFEDGHCLFNDLPLPQDLVSVVLEWQQLAWFIVEGSPYVYIHHIGVKPGGPVVDVLFAFAFHCVHQKLRTQTLLEMAPLRGKGIYPVGQVEEQVGIGAPPLWKI